MSKIFKVRPMIFYICNTLQRHLNPPYGHFMIFLVLCSSSPYFVWPFWLFFYSSVTGESLVDEMCIWRKCRISVLVYIYIMSLFYTLIILELFKYIKHLNVKHVRKLKCNYVNFPSSSKYPLKKLALTICL